MAAEGQSDKMASDMEARMKQRCGFEFLHTEKQTNKQTNKQKTLRNDNS